MSHEADHPLSLSSTGSFGEAARGAPARGGHARSRRVARLARLWPLMAVGLLAVGPLVAFGAYRMAAVQHDERVEARFHEAVQGRSQGIARQLDAYAEVLHAVQGLYDASEVVTRAEFATFTRQARGRHPCIDAIAWAPVAADDAPVAKRLAYIEPRARYEQLVRMDLGQGELVRPTLDRSLREPDPVLSPPLVGDLAGHSNSSYGLYALGVFASDTDGTRGEALGSVLVSFRFADLIRPEPGTEDAPRSMRLWLFDITPGDASELAALDGDRTEVATGLSASRDFELGGRRWRLTALPTAYFMQQHRSREPLGIAAIVLLVWELMAGLLLALSHASRSTAIRRQGRNVARILHSLGEGVIVAGRDGQVRLSNRAARDLIGAVVDDVDVVTFERAVRCANGDAPDPDGTPLQRAMRGEVFDDVPCYIKTPARPEGVHVVVSGSPLRDEWGALLGGVLAVRDDTERRRSERQLREKDAALHARQVEMDLAAAVQKRFYPAKPPRVHGLDLAGAVRPADETCGDYYDFLKLPDGSMLLAVGDVSGHGLGPALVMAETRAYVRSLARAGHGLREILERCNAQLCSDLADHQFVTMLLVRISAGGRTLAFSSAGHTPALLIGDDGLLRMAMKRSGPPLGVLEDHEYRIEEGIPLRPDDVLVLMTDGVTEAESADAEFFEEEGVIEVVAKHRHRDADSILREIGGALDRFAGERIRRDDVTLVVCKRTGGTARRRPHRSLTSTWTDS